jgi:cytochrome c-type biogenesis protein CcmH
MKRTMSTLRRACLAILLFAAAMVPPVHALSPAEQLKDQKLESRARDLSAELRCLVCQNQSIDDSDAPLAKDLRRLVRERLVAGDSNEQVKGFLVERYGDFVLLKPPFGWHTLLLWLAPLLVLLATLAFIARAARRQAVVPAPHGPAALTSQEEARLRDLLRKEGATPRKRGRVEKDA